MKQIRTNLHIGSSKDWPEANDRGWYVIQAAKEPFHREAVGYPPGRKAPDGPERLIAHRDRRLILNMIDSREPLFDQGMINHALEVASRQVASGNKVLIHCNQGQSRAPSLGLLFMALNDRDKIPDRLGDAIATFHSLYPAYAPSPGIASWVASHWRWYRTSAVPLI